MIATTMQACLSTITGRIIFGRTRSASSTILACLPSDEYFDYCFGRLPYRSLRFEPETFAQEFFQPAMQVNYPNNYDFTRIVEIEHAMGQKLPLTTIVREYPQDFRPDREPYYPIPAPDAKALYSKYAERAVSEKNVSFVGRLATYRYYTRSPDVFGQFSWSRSFKFVAPPPV